MNKVNPNVSPLTNVLSKKEYAKIIHEVNTLYYDSYKDKKIFAHYSVGLDNRYYVYYFENRGFDNYVLLDKYEH